MENLEIRRSTGAGSNTTILRLAGPLTLATLFDFQTAVRQPELKNVILDLSGVPYIDSGGLGVILSAWAHGQRSQSKFALAGVCERVKTLLDMTKVDSMLPQFATVEDAERNFGDNAAAAPR